MEAYKFKTTVEEEGVLRIPEIARLAHQQVEVFVVVAPDTEAGSAQTVQQFLDKWQGLLQDFDVEELKPQYLREKYEDHV